MRATQPANLALAIAVLAWPLLVYGALSQLGDPAPSTSAAALRHIWQISMLCLAAGLISLIAALWLSGFSYAAAPRRSIAVVFVVLVPAIVVLLGTVR